MNTFSVITKKEIMQYVREFKIIWLPLVFLFLGMTQPVITYYLPDILEAVGGNEGIIIDPNMAPQTGGEILAGTLGSQFDQLGVMIIVISIMGIVQADKENGMLAFILTRPVAVTSYMSGKIVSNYLLVALSVILGYMASYLYTALLFTSIPVSNLLMALLFYLLWVLFIVAFTTMVSTIFNHQGLIALISILVLLGCRIIVGVIPFLDYINPASMSDYALEWLVLGTVESSVIWTILVTILFSALVLFVANKWIADKKYTME